MRHYDKPRITDIKRLVMVAKKAEIQSSYFSKISVSKSNPKAQFPYHMVCPEFFLELDLKIVLHL